MNNIKDNTLLKGNSSLKDASFIQIAKRFSVLILLVVFIIIASIVSDSFFTVSNFLNLMQSYAAPGIIAIGMTFALLSSGTDLSVGSVAALAGMVAAMLLADGYPVWICVMMGVLSGALLGTLTGLIIVFFDIAPFIASLATMVSARGLSMLTTNGGVISGLIKLGNNGDTGQAFCFLGGGSIQIGPIEFPFAGFTWIILTLVAAYILRYTLYGRNLYAIGGNKEAAMLSGIPVKRFETIAWTISGMTAAYAGIMLTAWLTVAQPTLNQGAELDAIAATVMGGTSLNGGKGTVFGTFAGVMILAIITNLFNLIGLPSYYQQIFKGVIIIGAMLLNRFVSQKEN